MISDPGGCSPLMTQHCRLHVDSEERVCAGLNLSLEGHFEPMRALQFCWSPSLRPCRSMVALLVEIRMGRELELLCRNPPGRFGTGLDAGVVADCPAGNLERPDSIGLT